MTELPLVVVEWDDAWIDGNEPVALNEVGIEHKPLVICTMGRLLKDDETGVSLANEYYKDKDIYRGRTFIPRAMVRSVTRYKLSKPRPKKDRAVQTPPSEDLHKV
jgi:hypothetical protein